MNLREKILMECKKQNIELLKMLKNANVSDSNYYKEFLAIWKPRIAATLGVNEIEFFKGYESEIKVSRSIKSKAEYTKKKQALITILKERWLTIAEMRALTGANATEVNALIGSIRYKHIMEMKPLPGQKRSKLYHIIEEIDKNRGNVKSVPISKLPKKINKLDLLTWGINQKEQTFYTSHDLVKFAKKQGKEVYEYNGRGEVYYL